MRDPKSQILPLGTSLVPPWLHTGVFSPLLAAFQAVLLLTRKAPNTFPSHGGVVGPPSQEALIFQIGKKNGMREGGAREGDAFSLFSFWGRTHPAALAKWKKAVRARLVCRARRQPPGWLQLGQTGGVSYWSRGSGEVQGAHSSSGSTRHAAGVGDPALGCRGLAAPDTGTAAPVGTVSAGISGGISAPGGSRTWNAGPVKGRGSRCC